ncbi:hypothetical protein [Streptomyces sp. 1331.2]|uniref:hypothetical protein n=1 Tax=Streptomyces sp. 1331.2 TaxID=1938835 RepID=UPI0015CF3B18|nr:hypothetical protein [Streptomyces sp. 1331.2]
MSKPWPRQRKTAPARFLVDGKQAHCIALVKGSVLGGPDRYGPRTDPETVEHRR